MRICNFPLKLIMGLMIPSTFLTGDQTNVAISGHFFTSRSMYARFSLLNSAELVLMSSFTRGVMGHVVHHMKPEEIHSDSPFENDSADVLIAVMGATGSGKTTFINKVSGSELRVGQGLRSCTTSVQLSKSFELDGRTVTLIDTPGFDDTTKSDTDVLTMVAAFLATMYEKNATLAGVIYMHRISDFRMGGISTRNFKMFRKLCGEATLRNVVLVSNMWGEVSPAIGAARERELAEQDVFFKPVLDKGAQFLRHDNTMEGAQAILSSIINNHPIILKIQRELVDEQMDISETAAGEELGHELNELSKKYRVELKQLEADMQEALNAKDEETKQEIERETERLTAEMTRVQNESERLASAYNEERARVEARMKEMESKAREENERLQADYQRRMEGMSERLQKVQDTSSKERSELMNAMHQLQQQNADLARRQSRGGGLFTKIGRFIDSL
ncbi:hypothetical protein ONZ45_g1469 [Pleurotus djamor]|nr:hypothetical protein ONZ45_g1469 [Pleurotus djamor]